MSHVDDLRHKIDAAKAELDLKINGLKDELTRAFEKGFQILRDEIVKKTPRRR
jgi:hypothetical protein